MNNTLPVIIIGGGLSGLTIADELQQAGIGYLVLEGRSRLGGRIKIGEKDNSKFDLGPSWFWPGQPRLANLIDRFDLSYFDQFSKGTLSYEDENGSVYRDFGFASMEGSYRMKNGMIELINALSRGLDKDKVRLNSIVKQITNIDKIEVLLDDGTAIHSQQVILAVPPRVAANIVFEPTLSQSTIKSMHALPTWMGDQAKFFAIYEHPFWRDEGLSGDAMSRMGPLVEIHDASDEANGFAALFGFLGVPVEQRANQQETLKSSAIKQLARLFDDKALSPVHVLYKDWAFDSFTSSELDHIPLGSHPIYGLPQSMSGQWNDQLHFASTETATQFGGYLEGAIESGQRVASELIKQKKAL